MNHKHRAVISSYSDLSRISSNIRVLHFRKFISKNLLKKALKKCPDLEMISLSNYASKRLNINLQKLIKNIEIRISKSRGRPII